MISELTRRNFSRQIAYGLIAALSLNAQNPGTRKLKIGHTGITWGNDSEQAIKDISGLGYYGFETFGEVLEDWDKRGGLREILDVSSPAAQSPFAYRTFFSTWSTRP